jgi:hypothetical protein
MTTDTEPRARRRPTRRILVALLLATVDAAAFVLSFDAQTILATAAGADPHLAGLYPIVVDAAILTVTLIAAGAEHLRPTLTGYLWTALAFWAATSLAGNALHILALPPHRVTIPLPIALAVSSVPAVTLFLITHIAIVTSFRVKPKRTRTTTTASIPTEPKAAIRRRLRPDIPPAGLDEIMALADEGKTIAEIAETVNRSRSRVGELVKAERDRRAAEAQGGIPA